MITFSSDAVTRFTDASLPKHVLTFIGFSDGISDFLTRPEHPENEKREGTELSIDGYSPIKYHTFDAERPSHHDDISLFTLTV